jgi:hypothetical protein
MLRSSKGLTVVELTIVLAIIAVIGVSAITLGGSTAISSAKNEATVQNLEKLATWKNQIRLATSDSATYACWNQGNLSSTCSPVPNVASIVNDGVSVLPPKVLGSWATICSDVNSTIYARVFNILSACDPGWDAQVNYTKGANMTNFIVNYATLQL